MGYKNLRGQFQSIGGPAQAGGGAFGLSNGVNQAEGYVTPPAQYCSAPATPPLQSYQQPYQQPNHYKQQCSHRPACTW